MDACPKCGVADRTKPRWFGVPRNLFVLNGRVRARGEAGGSVRVYGWTVQRERYSTLFGGGVRHIDRIICPHSWHEWPEQAPSIRKFSRQVWNTAEERHAKYLAKRRRWEKRD